MSRDLSNYYVLKMERENFSKYLETVYQNNISLDESIDDAMKFPDAETPRSLGKYICWRHEEYTDYKVYCVRTVMSEASNETDAVG